MTFLGNTPDINFSFDQLEAVIAQYALLVYSTLNLPGYVHDELSAETVSGDELVTTVQDPVLGQKPGPGALFLERREIVKFLLNECFK